MYVYVYDDDDDDVSFYNSTAFSWTLATPRTTWELLGNVCGYAWPCISSLNCLGQKPDAIC